MKIVERLSDFPPTAPKLKGLPLEAYNVLETLTPDRPVLVISPDGANVAAVKRAFVSAAKFKGGSVETRNGEGGTILVRFSSSPRGHRTTPARAAIEHSDADVQAEMKRLYVSAGNKESDFPKLSADAARKLSISAKRNLSRRAVA